MGTDSVTLDDVWKLFHEVGEGFKDLEKRFQETDARFQQTDARFKQTDRMVQESRAEVDRIMKDLSRQVGDLTGRWGRFLEAVIAPACEWMFAERGVPVHEVYHRVKAKRDGGRNMEVDLLVVNDQTAVVVEVKSTLTVEDVREHLEHLAAFKRFFPRYVDCRVMGAVAGIVADPEVLAFARKQGLFVIVQSGESVRLDNDPDFVPAVW